MGPDLLFLLLLFFRHPSSSIAFTVISRVHFCRDENAAWPWQALGSAPYWLNCFHYGFLVLLPVCHELFLLLLLLFTAVFLGCNMYLMWDIYSWPHQWAAWQAGMGGGGCGGGRGSVKDLAVRRIPGGSWNSPAGSLHPFLMEASLHLSVSTAVTAFLSAGGALLNQGWSKPGGERVLGEGF